MEMLIGPFSQGDLVLFFATVVRVTLSLALILGAALVLKPFTDRPYIWFRRALPLLALALSLLFLAREVNQTLHASIRWTNGLQAEVDSLKK